MAGITTASSKQIFAAGIGSSSKGATPWHWLALNPAGIYTALNIKFGLLLFQNSGWLFGWRTSFLRQNNPYMCKHYWLCLHHQQAQKMCCPSAVLSTEHVSALQDRLWAAENRSPSVAISWQHAWMRKSKGWKDSGELLWYRTCGCDIPSSADAGGGGRTQAPGQEHANADLWLQQEERNLLASYPSLPPLSNHTDSGVRRCQKKYSKPLLLNFRVRDYQLPWKCHTYKKNYVQHILLEEKLSASHYTCVYPAQVWDQIGSAHLSCLIGYNYWLPAILCFIGILFCRGIWIWQTAPSSAAMFWFSWTAEKGQCTHQSLCSLFFKGAEIQRACLQRALFSAVAGASCLIGRGISVWPLFIFH